jgi:hypothetical protein
LLACHRRHLYIVVVSTHNPPCEQWLAAAEVGAGSCRSPLMMVQEGEMALGWFSFLCVWLGLVSGDIVGLQSAGVLTLWVLRSMAVRERVVTPLTCVWGEGGGLAARKPPPSHIWSEGGVGGWKTRENPTHSCLGREWGVSSKETPSISCLEQGRGQQFENEW